MTPTQPEPTTAERRSGSRLAVFIEELFIVLTVGGLIHLTVKALRHQPVLEASR